MPEPTPRSGRSSPLPMPGRARSFCCPLVPANPARSRRGIYRPQSQKFLPPDEKRILISSGEPRSYLQLLDNDTPHPITPTGVFANMVHSGWRFFLDVISDAIGSHSECLD